MNMENINWKSVITSAILIWIIPALVNLVLGFGYSIIIGFQTRGDTEAIQAASAVFSTSIYLRVAIWLCMIIVAFWQSRKIAQTVSESPVMNALLATIIAMIITTVVFLLSKGTVVYLLISWILVLGAAYIGASRK